MTKDLFENFRPWVENKLGVSFDVLGTDPIPVVSSEPRDAGPLQLWAVRVGSKGLVTARSEWVEKLRPIVERLSSDELFTVFGCYEMGKVTLPDGFGVFGPSWHLIGDRGCFQPVWDERPVQLDKDEITAAADPEIFWHSLIGEAEVGFGIFEKDKLVALAGVVELECGVWEIGMDVKPGVRWKGLGRTVVSAAGEWILKYGGLILAKTAPWNVPSARTLRSVGLKNVLSGIMSLSGDFPIPPQPLGKPFPEAKLYNYYPNWAMNKDIKSKSAIHQQ